MKSLHSFLAIFFSLLPCMSYASMQNEDADEEPFALVAYSPTDSTYYAVKAEYTVKSGAYYYYAEKVPIVGDKLVMDKEIPEITWSIVDRHLYNATGKWLAKGGPVLEKNVTTRTLNFYKDSIDGKYFVHDPDNNDFGFRYYKTSGKFVYSNKLSYPCSYIYYFTQGYIRQDLGRGNFGTICLPYSVENAEWSGATFYEIAGKHMFEDVVTSISLRKVSHLEAGRPYIFLSESDTLAAAYSGVMTETAGSHNGLVGSLVGMDVDEGMYLINENVVRQCGTRCSIGPNRAYINMSEVPILPEGAGSVDLEMRMYGLPTEINTPITPDKTNEAVYDLLGRPVRNVFKGVIIHTDRTKTMH